MIYHLYTLLMPFKYSLRLNRVALETISIKDSANFSTVPPNPGDTFTRKILRAVSIITSGIFLSAAQVAPVKAQEPSLGEIVDIGTEYLSRVSSTFRLGKPPRFIIGIKGQKTPTGCTNTSVDGSYFCAIDETIAIEPLQLEAIRAANGPGGVIFVLAHEYGHFLQWKQRVSLAIPFQELQADCIAGAMLLSGETDAISTMGINKQDAYEMIAAAYQAGGGDVHGSSEQRAEQVIRGANGGMNSCGVRTLNSQQVLIAQNNLGGSQEPPLSSQVLGKFEQIRNKACKVSTEDSGRPYKWDDPSSFKRLLYIQSERRTLRHSNLQLLGCLPLELEGFKLGLTLPRGFDAKSIGFFRCTPGIHLRPLTCYQKINSEIQRTEGGTIVITPKDQVAKGTLFALNISSNNPSNAGIYQINLLAARVGTSEPYYVGSYLIEYN